MYCFIPCNLRKITLNMGGVIRHTLGKVVFPLHCISVTVGTEGKSGNLHSRFLIHRRMLLRVYPAGMENDQTDVSTLLRVPSKQFLRLIAASATTASKVDATILYK